MQLPNAKYHYLIIVATWLLLFTTHLNVIDVNIMEARNFVTAREMLNDTNWLLTTMDGQPRYEKPPLPTWLTAVSASLFGIGTLWALRLPAALITLVLLVFSYRFVNRLTKNTHHALTAVLILVTSFYIVLSGRNGTWDIFAHAFMVAGIYYLFRLFSNTTSLWRVAILSGLFIGLSFMSKGPVAHYVLLLPFLVSYGLVYGYKTLKAKGAHIFVIVTIAVLLSCWWPLYVYAFDADTATTIANEEASAWKNRNVRPFYYYWSFFTQSGIWTIMAFVSLLYPYMKSRVANLKAYKFTLFWTLISLVLLSVIPEKKTRYLLPVLVPLAFNCSFYLQYLIRSFSDIKDWRERLPVNLNGVLLALIAFAFPVVAYFAFKNQLDGLWIWYVLLSLTLVLLGFLILYALMRKDMIAFFLTFIAYMIAVTSLGMPLANIFYGNPNYRVVAAEGIQYQGTPLSVYTFKSLSPEFVWQYGEKIPRLNIKKSSNQILPDSYGVLVDETTMDELDSLSEQQSVKLIDSFDLNRGKPLSSGYKTRLKIDLYLVSAAETNSQFSN